MGRAEKSSKRPRGARWISQDAANFVGGDASRIVLVGWSAGTQLAMGLADQEGPSSIWGTCDCKKPSMWGKDDVPAARGPILPNVRGILEAFIGGAPDQNPGTLRERVTDQLGMGKP